MRLLIPAKTLFLLIALFAWMPALGFAQQAPESQDQANQASNITKENDRLPFMKNEQSAESQEPGTGSLLIKTLGAMLLIGGLIFFGAWGLKKFGFGNLKPAAAATLEAPDLAILTSVSLGSGRTVSTIQFGERVLLIGSTAQSFVLLAEETAPAAAAEKKFAGLMTTPRSVAELLGEENDSFEDELELAQNRLGFRSEKAEGIS